jgi:GH3 auxin-responsive promoter
MLDATPLLRLYARYRLPRLAALDPAKAQARQLMSLVARAKGTRFGLDHSFAHIRSIADYQSAVPLRRYEDFWSVYWGGSFPILEGIT